MNLNLKEVFRGKVVNRAHTINTGVDEFPRYVLEYLIDNYFAEYLATAKSGRPLKEVRKEALVAGFTEAYRAGRYADILAVGRKLPRRLVEDSPDIYDFVNIAEAQMEG